MNGLMMDSQLTITSIMKHADRIHSKSKIVSVTSDNPHHSYAYGDALLAFRARVRSRGIRGIRTGFLHPEFRHRRRQRSFRLLRRRGALLAPHRLRGVFPVLTHRVRAEIHRGQPFAPAFHAVEAPVPLRRVAAGSDTQGGHRGEAPRCGGTPIGVESFS